MSLPPSESAAGREHSPYCQVTVHSEITQTKNNGLEMGIFGPKTGSGIIFDYN